MEDNIYVTISEDKSGRENYLNISKIAGSLAVRSVDDFDRASKFTDKEEAEQVTKAIEILAFIGNISTGMADKKFKTITYSRMD